MAVNGIRLTDLVGQKIYCCQKCGTVFNLDYTYAAQNQGWKSPKTSKRIGRCPVCSEGAVEED